MRRVRFDLWHASQLPGTRETGGGTTRQKDRQRALAYKLWRLGGGWAYAEPERPREPGTVRLYSHDMDDPAVDRVEGVLDLLVQTEAVLLARGDRP